VGDDDLAVFGITAGGNKGVQCSGNAERSRGFDPVQLIVFLDVVLPFLGGISMPPHPTDRSSSCRDAMGIDAIGDALQLLPVLPLNVWPHHVLRGIAKELPVFLAFVCLFEDGDLQSAAISGASR